MSVCTMTPALVYSFTCQPINSQTNTPANPLTCRLVNMPPRHLINLNPCQLFGMDFNIKRALFVHQPPALPQKIDSRGGLS